tara:strand:+ start:712 stop:1116 length:405 start_codon:yes stop_codon:yes gene_type:complete
MPNVEKYSCYVFVHTHLSAIQKGVQAAHAVAELVNHETKLPIENQSVGFDQWIKKDKTMIFLDGGNTKQLWGKYHQFALEDSRNGQDSLPYIWREDAETLGTLVTAFAVIFKSNCSGGSIREQIIRDCSLLRAT